MAKDTVLTFRGRASARLRGAVAGLSALTLLAVTGVEIEAALRQELPSSPIPEQLGQLVVAVRGSVNDVALFGAGLIFARGPDRLYIVTAEHVVSDGPVRADEVEVQLWWKSGEWTPARVADTVDRDLDVAVILVDTRSLHIPELEWRMLYRPDGLVRGDHVRPFGHPAGVIWHLPVLTHRVSEVSGQAIRTEGDLQRGHSGGVLVTEDGSIVGMLTHKDLVHAESLRIDRVLDRLQQWRYRPDITFRDVGPAAPAIACHVSGRVLDEERGTPLAGVDVGLGSDSGGRVETVMGKVATTGPDGRFEFSCPGSIQRDDFPLTIELSRADWRATLVTAVEIGVGGQHQGLDILARPQPRAGAGAETPPPASCVPQPVRPQAGAKLAQRRLQDGRVSTTWHFSWRPCDGATRYHLYVSHQGAQNPIVNVDTVRATTYTDQSTHYGVTSLTGWTWRVRARLGNRWSEWSESRSFSVAPVPAAGDEPNVRDHRTVRDHRCSEPAPAPRPETRPARREGYVWTPGRWECRDGSWTWISGHWARRRSG